MGNGNPAWVKGVSGNPAGRPKLQETYNRAEIVKICRERGFHPVHALIDIYEDPKSSGYLKMECAKEVGSYIMAKVRTVQLTDGNDGPASITIKWDNDPPPLSVEQHDDAKQQFVDGMTDAQAKIMDAIVNDDEDER